jgi:hypothetical protein
MSSALTQITALPKLSTTPLLAQITALLPQLSFGDKLALLRLTTLELSLKPVVDAVYQHVIAQEERLTSEAAQEPIVAPAAASKAPKKASGGTMAWMSFVKHCQETQPSRFADSKDRGHVLSVAKEIRHEDEDAYKSFVSEWHTDDETEAEEVTQPKLKKAKKVKQAEGAETEPKAKRPANPGILAFTAYSKHLMETQPQLFTEAKSHGDKLKIVSQSSKDSREAYETFVSEWKTAHNFSAAANYLKASPPFAAVGGGGAAAAE